MKTVDEVHEILDGDRSRELLYIARNLLTHAQATPHLFPNDRARQTIEAIDKHIRIEELS